MQNGFYNMDCMEGMAQFPDNHFDLAIVDPPYGIGESTKKRENTKSDKWKSPYKKKQHNTKEWDKKKPEKEYWAELFRVSKNQIVWGGNYFITNLSERMCWLVWDKKNSNSDFSDCELAWTSFDRGVRKFEWLWNGFQKEKPEIRIHPTQKPVALYKWLLENYAKQGDLILDTHVGSASSLIACEALSFEYVGFELDEEYFTTAQKRLADWRLMPLFDNAPNNDQLDLAI